MDAGIQDSLPFASKRHRIILCSDDIQIRKPMNAFWCLGLVGLDFVSLGQFRKKADLDEGREHSFILSADIY